MKVIEIKSTKDFKRAFPELSRTNNFKRKLDEVFDMGYSFNLKVCEPVDDGHEYWTSSKSGKTYFAMLVHDGSGWYISKVKFQHNRLAEDGYSPSGTTIHVNKKGDSPMGKSGDEDLFLYEVMIRDEVNWAVLCQIIGSAIKDEFVHHVNCSKCGGSGKIAQYMHVHNGTCFECMGIGKWPELIES